MVEFAAVLMAKQRMDWNENTEDKKHEILMIKPKKYKIDLPSDGGNTVDDTGKKDGIVKSKNILENCKLTKDMPPYRKMDVISFVLFSGLYICFNLIYFVTCLKY